MYCIWFTVIPHKWLMSPVCLTTNKRTASWLWLLLLCCTHWAWMTTVRMIHGLLHRVIVEAFKWLHLKWPADVTQTEPEYKIRLSHDAATVTRHTDMNSVMHKFEFTAKYSAQVEMTALVHQWKSGFLSAVLFCFHSLAPYIYNVSNKNDLGESRPAGLLKGHSINFTCENQFTNHGKYYSACCMMSSVALEELHQLWEKHSSDLIWVISALRIILFIAKLALRTGGIRLNNVNIYQRHYQGALWEV